jgi:hypothetical protein
MKATTQPAPVTPSAMLSYTFRRMPPSMSIQQAMPRAASRFRTSTTCRGRASPSTCFNTC